MMPKQSSKICAISFQKVTVFFQVATSTLSDLLAHQPSLKNIGRIIAKSFMDQKIDAVMTVATKGVPLANAVANVLNVPFVIVRRDLKIT